MFCGPRRKSPHYSMMDSGAIVRGDEEHRMQVALFKWAQAATCTRPELGLMFAVPNGGLRDIVTARKLKDEGVKRRELPAWLARAGASQALRGNSSQRPPCCCVNAGHAWRVSQTPRKCCGWTPRGESQ